MNKKTNFAIIFSLLVLLALFGYLFLNKKRLGLSGPDPAGPTAQPPALSAEEKERILSTLEARKKESLTPEQKLKILNSLTVPE